MFPTPSRRTRSKPHIHVLTCNGCFTPEPLERRSLFAAVPVVGPYVIDARFDPSHAPHEIRITFNEDVSQSLDASDLALINALSRYVVPHEFMTVTWEAETNTASFIFVRLDDGGVLAEGPWHASLRSEGITNSDGEPLDGDNDQRTGGDFTFEFSFIRGDANQDGRVDFRDYDICRSNFGESARNFLDGDFNYDDRVDLRDLNILISRFGATASNLTGGAVFSSHGFSDDRIRAGDDTLPA